MQENFYDLLTRHFFGKTTEEEEKVIDQYKADHADEYTRLRKFFAEKNISLKTFDSAQGWQKVMEKYRSQKATTRTLPLYRPLRIAAGIALLAVVLSGIYLLVNRATTLAPTQLVANGQAQEKVVLSDGSVIWLNDNAQLLYPETFTGDERSVTLRGEAFFEVARNTESPFIVRTQSAEVKVLGTSFNVNTRGAGTEVAVATGTVQVKSATTENNVVVTAGFSAKADQGNVTSYTTANDNYQAWRTGVFQFRQTPLRTVVADLNTYYSGKIQFATDRAIDCALTARFNQTSLNEVIEVLKLTCNLSVEETKEGTFLIR